MMEAALIGKVAACVVGSAAVGISAVSLPFITPAFRRVCLPFVPATDAQVANLSLALSHCPRDGHLLDIGSGDGRIVFAAAKLGFRRATGVELNPWLVLYSRILARKRRLHKSVSFVRRDLWKLPLANFDTVTIFGTETLMPELEAKFVRELREGALVVACRYPLSSAREPLTSFGEGLDCAWLYRF